MGEYPWSPVILAFRATGGRFLWEFGVTILRRVGLIETGLLRGGYGRFSLYL